MEKQELEWDQEEAILEEDLRYREYMKEQQEKLEKSEYKILKTSISRIEKKNLNGRKNKNSRDKNSNGKIS